MVFFVQFCIHGYFYSVHMSIKTSIYRMNCLGTIIQAPYPWSSSCVMILGSGWPSIGGLYNRAAFVKHKCKTKNTIKSHLTLSRWIDRMELEFPFKFDALALQFKSTSREGT